jgi:hypothetical protein
MRALMPCHQTSRAAPRLHVRMTCQCLRIAPGGGALRLEQSDDVASVAQYAALRQCCERVPRTLGDVIQAWHRSGLCSRFQGQGTCTCLTHWSRACSRRLAAPLHSDARVFLLVGDRGVAPRASLPASAPRFRQLGTSPSESCWEPQRSAPWSRAVQQPHPGGGGSCVP